jgi:hypothetical protein
MLDRLATFLAIVVFTGILVTAGCFVVDDYMRLHRRVQNLEYRLEHPIIIPIPDTNMPASNYHHLI